MSTEEQKATVVYLILEKGDPEEKPLVTGNLPELDDEYLEADSGNEPDSAEGENEPEADPVSWNIVFPNGETVLERQLRLLSSRGIRDFVLAMEEYPKDKAEELVNALTLRLPVNCSVRHIALDETVRDMQKELSEDRKADSVLLLSGCAVYDLKYARNLVLAENGSMFLSKSAVNRQDAREFARIDFKCVCELGGEDKGVSWFPVLHFYKLDTARALQLEPGADPIQAIEGKIEQLEMMPAFDSDGYVRLPEDSGSLAACYKQMLRRDYESRRIEEKRACIAEVSEWLNELQVRKPLLVYDRIGLNTPVADVLGYWSVSFVEASAEGKTLSDILELCRQEQCDSVISAGGECAVHAAKLLRVCCMFDIGLSGNTQPIRIVRYFPHISIPLTRSAIPINTGCNMLSPCIEGLQPFHMIPDLTAWDPSLKTTRYTIKKPAKRRINRSGKQTGPVPSASRMLRPFPKVRRRLRNAYKAAMFTWYKHRYVMRNQAVVFSSFQGRQAYDNPRGIYEAMRKAPEYNGFHYIWAVTAPQSYKTLSKNPDTRVVKYGSKAHLRALATARYIVDNVRLPNYVKLRPEQEYIQTWHGKPIRHIGQDVISKTAGGNGRDENKKIFSRDAKMISHLCVPSAAFVPFFTSAYNLKELGRESIITETGYPRNDFLFRYTEKDVLRKKLALGIPLNKKVVLYAPARRPVSYEKGKGYIYHSTVDFQQLYEELGDGYIVMFRASINEAKSVNFPALKDFVLDMTMVRNINDLLIISDLLISDYSGIIFDFANLRRPIVLYQYDREEYVNGLTGVYFNPDEIPGAVVTDQAMLAQAIKDEMSSFTYDEKYRRFNETYNTLDGADCGLRTAQALISPDLLKTKSQVKQGKRLDFYQGLSTRATGFLRVTGLKRTENDKQLLSFKGKHKGERCFLVGNGPSLRLEDLEAIRCEYSFACNRIYKSFDRTNWRPTYYCFTDHVFESELGNIRNTFSGTLFSNNTFSKKEFRQFHIVCAHNIKSHKYTVHGNMLEYYVPSNATVMTFMIELAMYMGFSEIYLLGVDCSNGFVNSSSHFMSGYQTEEMKKVELRRMRNLAKGDQIMTPEELGQYRVDRSLEAYKKIRNYADKHHIKIVNATKGGCLEAFERADLEEITLKKHV